MVCIARITLQTVTVVRFINHSCFVMYTNKQYIFNRNCKAADVRVPPKYTLVLNQEMCTIIPTGVNLALIHIVNVTYSISRL